MAENDTAGVNAGESKGAVLLVDDDPSILSMLNSVLTEAGIETAKAATVEEAVQQFAGEAFSLVITDIYLPDGTGLELAGKVKAVNSEIPVIIMTGTPRGDNIRKSMEIDADAYLTKPLEIEKVLTLVGKFLARR